MGMSSKQKQIPAIRFEGFTDAWEQRKFFDNIQNTIDFRGRTPKKLGMDWSESGYLALSALNVKNGYIDPSADAHYGDGELYKKWMGGRELRKGQVLFTTEAPMGNVAQVPDNQGYILSQRTITFDVNDEKITDDFLAVLLRSPNVFNDLSALASGGTAKGVSQKSLSGLKVIVPRNLCEQEKIGLFFKQLDSAIALHQRQLDNCKQLKSSMMQKIFNQELRFKDENGKDYPEWQKYDLSEIVDRVTRKNTGLISELPLTISAQYGLVDQLTFFNKTIAGVNLEAYYLLKNGEFAYNKSYSSGYPLGAIKRLDKYDAGLLSTLYICFSPRNNVDSDFLTQYFESTKWHKQIVNISGEGARNHGLLNIAVGDFFSTEHILPCKEEQQRIANLLYSLDKMIDLSKRKVESLNEQKKGLVRLMFV